MYENARKYGLTGTDAMVFEALVFLCKKTGSWKGSTYKLAAFSCCGNRMTAQRAMQRLINAGLIAQNEPGMVQIVPQIAQNEPNPKEKRTKKENNKQIKIKPPSSKEECVGGGLVDFSDDFLDFWKKYNPQPQFDNRKIKCYEQWQKLPQDWRALALDKAEMHVPDTNPFFWLKEETFLRISISPVVVPMGKTPPPEKPQWLSGTELEDCLRGGIRLVVCRNPETGKFGTVTVDDAQKFNLEIHHQL